VFRRVVRKFHDAKVGGQPVPLWGVGVGARGGIRNVDDLASLCMCWTSTTTRANHVGVGEEACRSAELPHRTPTCLGSTGELRWEIRPDANTRKSCSSLPDQRSGLAVAHRNARGDRADICLVVDT